MVRCPRCSVEIRTSAINAERALAKCDACNAVFSFEAQLRRDLAGEPVPMPTSITVEVGPPSDVEPTLCLTWRWFHWFGMVPVFTSLALFLSSVLINHPFLLVVSVPWCAGMMYWGVAVLRNRTTITVDRHTLTVRHEPLPWAGSMTLETDRVRQLFVRRRFWKRGDGSNVRYMLVADVDGRAVDLVRDLNTLDEARFLERQIEQHLAIVDNPSVS